ncbi:MAG: hypothetical protein U1E38_04910 [Rhodospirillales bacterium]
MLLWLLAGIGLLFLALGTVRWAAAADPKALIFALKSAAITVAAVVGVLLLLSGRGGWLLGCCRCCCPSCSAAAASVALASAVSISAASAAAGRPVGPRRCRRASLTCISTTTPANLTGRFARGRTPAAR